MSRNGEKVNRPHPQAPPQEVLGDLVVATLCVAGWTLEDCWNIRDGLRQEGLFTLEGLSTKTRPGLFEALERAGYARGEYVVGLLSDRLYYIGRVLADGGLAKLNELLATGSSAELDQYLLEMKGIGPTVLSSFKLLRGAR